MLQGLNNLAVIYTSQGKAQEALQTLQAATLADPNYAEAYVCTEPLSNASSLSPASGVTLARHNNLICAVAELASCMQLVMPHCSATKAHDVAGMCLQACWSPTMQRS